MEDGTTPTEEQPNAGLRARMKRANELQTLPPETLDALLNLPDRLDRATERTSLVLDETTVRLSTTLQNTVLRPLIEQERALTGTERNLAHTTEILRRQADRLTWMQTSVILLALMAGILGGAAAALPIVHWMQ